MATRTYSIISYDAPVARLLDEADTKAEALQRASNLSKSGTPAFVQQYENSRPTRSYAV